MRSQRMHLLVWYNSYVLILVLNVTVFCSERGLLAKKNNNLEMMLRCYRKFAVIVAITGIIFSGLSAFSVLPQVDAVKFQQCGAGTGSAPHGIEVDGSNVYMGLPGNHWVGISPSSNCFVSGYPVPNDPTNVALLGNGLLGFSSKGTGGSSPSCISGFNTSTHTVATSNCQTGWGFDVVAKDPTNSNYAWVSAYYVSNFGFLDTTTGNLTYWHLPTISQDCGTSNPSPEGLKVDNSGNVWIADEGCHILWELPASNHSIFNYWDNLGGVAYTPWYLSIDNTNNKIWISATPNNQVINFNISTNAVTTIPRQTGDTSPQGIAADPANNRVDVAFRDSSTVNEWSPSAGEWICGNPSGDSYPGSSPLGISNQSPNYYWATGPLTDTIYVGDC